MERDVNDASVTMVIGRLTQAIQTLTFEVNTLRTKMEDVERKMNTGKGVMTGLFLAAGGVGAGVSHLFQKLFHTT